MADALTRLRHLLALADSPNENEAAAAALAAARHIKKHGITFALPAAAAPPPPPRPAPGPGPNPFDPRPYMSPEDILREWGRQRQRTPHQDLMDELLRSVRHQEEQARAVAKIQCEMLGHDWRRHDAYLAVCQRCGAKKT